MHITVRKYEEKDLAAMVAIWNEVVEEGLAFPQEEGLTLATGKEFFAAQSRVAVSEGQADKKIYGLYILHPNNVGRVGHIANASYAVGSAARGMHIGELLVKDSQQHLADFGFKILQFNAVVISNVHARHLYTRLGFKEIGVVPKGFRNKQGVYEDIVLYCYTGKEALA